MTNDDVSQILDTCGTANIADDKLSGAEIDEATACIGAEFLDRGLDGRQFYIQHCQQAQIRHDAIFAYLAADWDDLRDAGNGQKLRPDNEVGDLAQGHRIGTIARHGYQHDLAHDRGDRSHLGDHVARQLLADKLQALGHLLTGEIDVGGPIELDVNHGKADARDGA
jgi:hypothetical protein